MVRALVACAMLGSTLPARAIEGRYRVEGTNPGQAAVYRGEALVRRTGDTYAVAWEIGATRQVGTGILADGVLSIVFQSMGTQSFGVARFAVAGNRVTDGSWSVLGARALGTERWTPITAP